MTVSLCIVALNEEIHLPKLLEQVLSQDFPKSETELVFVDSGSSDGTKDIFSDFAENNKKNYIDIKLIDNPEKSQAAGWNKAISSALGDCIIRLDAHAEIPKDFLKRNIDCIESGENVCGGARPNIAENNSAFQKMLLAAESSMFGSSFAGYRRKNDGRKYVSSVFHGCYRREVFEKVGGFDESLGRTEDNELHWRINESGYRICQDSKIISYQLIRANLSDLLKQKYGNGKWIGLTTGVCPDCISIFHFVPFCFLVCVTLGIVMSFLGIFLDLWQLSIPIIIIAAAYTAADLLMTVSAVLGNEKNIYMFFLPFVFLLLHLSYGIGTAEGLIKMPFWRKNLDGSSKKRIEEVRKKVIENSTKKR